MIQNVSERTFLSFWHHQTFSHQSNRDIISSSNHFFWSQVPVFREMKWKRFPADDACQPSRDGPRTLNTGLWFNEQALQEKSSVSGSQCCSGLKAPALATGHAEQQINTWSHISRWELHIRQFWSHSWANGRVMSNSVRSRRRKENITRMTHDDGLILRGNHS